jgi:hypothetical protein
MSGLGRKYCSNRCRDLTKNYGIAAIPENVGRQVTYRLLAPAHYNQVWRDPLFFLFLLVSQSVSQSYVRQGGFSSYHLLPTQQLTGYIICAWASL